MLCRNGFAWLCPRHVSAPRRFCRVTIASKDDMPALFIIASIWGWMFCIPLDCRNGRSLFHGPSDPLSRNVRQSCTRNLTPIEYLVLLETETMHARTRSSTGKAFWSLETVLLFLFVEHTTLILPARGSSIAVLEVRLHSVLVVILTISSTMSGLCVHWPTSFRTRLEYSSPF